MRIIKVEDSVKQIFAYNYNTRRFDLIDQTNFRFSNTPIVFQFGTYELTVFNKIILINLGN